MIAIHDSRGFRFVRSVGALMGIIALLLVALELALTPAVNRALASAGGAWAVHVEDVELRPWRAAVRLEGVTVLARATGVDGTVVRVPHLDVAVDVNALLARRPAARASVHAPLARLVRGDDGALDLSMTRLLATLLPLPLDRVDIDGGTVFVAWARDAVRAHDLKLMNVSVHANNLANVSADAAALFARVRFGAAVDGGGDVHGVVRVDPRAARPTFALDAALRGLPLAHLNAWGAFSFAGGTLDVVTHVDASDGRFHGTVRPDTHGMVVALPGDAAPRVVAAVVDNAARLWTAPEQQRGGRFRGVDVVSAIVSALVSALAEALRPLVDDAGAR